jgi:hypothetical protein
MSIISISSAIVGSYAPIKNFIDFLSSKDEEIILLLEVKNNLKVNIVKFLHPIMCNDTSQPNYGHIIGLRTFTFYMENKKSYGMTNIQPTYNNAMAKVYTENLVTPKEWNDMMAAIEDRYDAPIYDLTNGYLSYI